MLRTLTGRLTFCFTALFGLLSIVAFAIIYVNLRSSLERKIDDHLASEALEIAQAVRSSGLEEAGRWIKVESESDGVDQVFYRLFSPGLDLLASSDLSEWQDLESGAFLPATAGARRFQTLDLPGQEYGVRTIIQQLADGNIIQIGCLLADETRLLAHIRKSFGFAFSVVLFGGALIGFLVAKGAMRGVEKIRETADRISLGDLSLRVPAGGEPEEIENLGRAFNRMQERIQAMVDEMREVSNNIAHDLRSPLTRIRGLAETTLTGNQDLEDYREMAGAVVEECDGLVNMVNTMLEIAETDAGVRKIPDTPVDMADIVTNVGDLFLPVAEDNGIDLQVAVSGLPLTTRGDRARLQRAVANLLDNAIKYTPGGGQVKITAVAAGSQVLVDITDTGIGIPEEDRQRIFQRFFRRDQSRSTPGTGLGLSLAQTVVHAHGGRITVASTADKGSTFTIALPRNLD